MGGQGQEGQGQEGQESVPTHRWKVITHGLCRLRAGLRVDPDVVDNERLAVVVLFVVKLVLVTASRQPGVNTAVGRVLERVEVRARSVPRDTGWQWSLPGDYLVAPTRA